MRRLAVLTLLLGAVPAVSHAQRSQEVTSFVEIAMLRDDNVVWRPLPELDHVWRVTPGLQISRDTARSRFFLGGEFDAERYSRLTNLTTMAARQHAAQTWQWRPLVSSTVAFESGYDNSVNPTDLNVGNGLILGRLRAWQWYFKPSYTHAIDGRRSLVTSYRLGGEHTELTPRILTHRAEIGWLDHPNARDELYPSYTAEVFQFATGRRLAHLGLMRWSHRISPAVRATAAGGARFYDGALRPNIQLEVDRRAGFASAGIGYSWTQVTAIGVTTLVDVQNLQASVDYTGPRGHGVFATGAYYHTALGDEAANVWRASGGLALRLAGPFSLTATTAVDYQRGRVSRVLTVEPVPLGSAPLVPIVAPANGPLRRTMFVLALRIAGTTRSAAGPGSEDERDADRERPRGGRRR